MDDLVPEQDWAVSTHGSEMSQVNGDPEESWSITVGTPQLHNL